MCRLMLAGLLFVALPVVALAQEDKDKEKSPTKGAETMSTTPTASVVERDIAGSKVRAEVVYVVNPGTIPVWGHVVLIVLELLLLLLILFQLMMLRSTLERSSGGPS